MHGVGKEPWRSSQFFLLIVSSSFPAGASWELAVKLFREELVEKLLKEGNIIQLQLGNHLGVFGSLSLAQNRASLARHMGYRDDVISKFAAHGGGVRQ